MHRFVDLQRFNRRLPLSFVEVSMKMGPVTDCRGVMDLARESDIEVSEDEGDVVWWGVLDELLQDIRK